METNNYQPRTENGMCHHLITAYGNLYSIELNERDISMLLQILRRDIKAAIQKDVTMEETIKILHAATKCKPARPLGSGWARYGYIKPFNDVFVNPNEPHEWKYVAPYSRELSDFFFQGDVSTFEF